MVRLGYYTGKLYSSDVDPESIKECCMMLNYKEPVLENDPFVIQKRKMLRERCYNCSDCEESQKHT